MDDDAGIVEQGDVADDVAALFDEVVAAARTLGDRPVDAAAKERIWSGERFADTLVRLPGALAERGLGPGQGMLVGARPGADGALLVLAALRVGARVEELAVGSGLATMQAQVRRLEPAWVALDSLLYLAGARSPLRWYLRRRGVEIPRLAALAATHVRLGGRLPGVPRGAVSLARLCEGSDPGAALPAIDTQAGRAFVARVRSGEPAPTDRASFVAALLAARDDL